MPAAEFDVPGAAEHEVAGTSRYLRRLIVRPHDRQIVMVLETPNVGTRLIPDGSSIRYTLQASGSWKCSADGVPERYLPARCRRH